MERILFASDLDNTLLFSYQYRQAEDKCVEYLDGREQGFFTRRTLELLPLVERKTRFVPVTTRSVAQYQRIQWPENCVPEYAAAANGGILLVNGAVDREWYARTEALTAPWRSELAELHSRLLEVSVSKRCRMVDDIYLFAACDSREEAERIGDFLTGTTTLETAVSGRKVYFFPPPINKGEALKRLRERFLPERTVCAGDSVIDFPMLRSAGLALVPDGVELAEAGGRVLCGPGGGVRFPDFVLESVLKEADAGPGACSMSGLCVPRLRPE